MQALAFYRGELDEAPGLSRVGDVMTVARRPWDPPVEIVLITGAGNRVLHHRFDRLPDWGGRGELAPFYDILPMVLAPSNDELPDGRLRPRSAGETDPVVASWVSDLLRRVDADKEISRPFIELWRRHIGA